MMRALPLILSLTTVNALVPKVSVCTGSVCSKHGSALVLEAAQALSCTTDSVTVVSTKCMQACKSNGLIKPARCAAFIHAAKAKAIMDGPEDIDAAVPIAFDALTNDANIIGSELLREAVESKLSGDHAQETGDTVGAIAAFSSAISAVAPETRGAFNSAAAAQASKASGPPKLNGLPPSRRAAAVLKERERTMPGDVRWLFEALVGRCRARLTLGKDDLDAALADALEATRLCPLAPVGWAALGEVAEANGDAELVATAAEEMRRCEPL